MTAAVVDTAGFRFARLTEIDDPNFLPGSVKYGDLPGMLALAAPRRLWLAGEGATAPQIVRDTYAAAEKGTEISSYSGDEPAEGQAAVEWLLK